MNFENKLRKVKNKDEWDIYSGNFKIGKLYNSNRLHYLYFDDTMEFSIEELQEVINLCKNKVIKKGQLYNKEFILLKFKRLDDVKKHIKICEGKHIQQVAYSSYHDALTQICFNCKKIVTNLKDFEK